MKLHLSKEFYTEENIKKCCEDFKEFLDYELEDETLTITPKEEVKDIEYKLCNYIFQNEQD